MSNEGLPTLNDLFDQNFGADRNDDPDGGFEDVESQSDFEGDGTEQSGETSEVPAKLSDLFAPEEDTQSDEDGQGQAPVDLAQEITLPDGRRFTVQELLDGSMMRADYTQKTQALAEERKAFDAEREALEAARDIREMLQSDPIGTITEMALRAGIIDERTAQDARSRNRNVSADEVLPAKKQADVDIDALVEQKLQELLQQTPVMQEYETQRAVQEVNKVFDYIEQSYETKLDEADRNAVLRAALELEEGNLELVYLKLDAMLKQRQAQKARVKSATPKKSVRGVQPTDADAQTEPPKTLEEAWRRTSALLGA